MKLDSSSAKNEVIKLTQELVRIKSVNPPGDELPAAELLAQRLKKYGLETEVVEVGKNRANVVAVLKGREERPALMFNGHLDVVPIGERETWQRDPFSGDIVENKIWGRGASDMKGGIAAMSVAAGLLATRGGLKGDLYVTAFAGEESDSIGAKHYVEHNSLEGIGSIIIPESTSLDIVVAEKGTLWLEFETYGKSAHSTQPHIGINAVEHMLTLLQMVKSAWEAIPYVPDRYLSPPTMNIATINGGIKTNSIPDRCVATVDLRPVPNQSHDLILSRMGEVIEEVKRKVPNFRAEMRVINERQPVATDEREEIVKVAKELGSSIVGRDLGLFGVNFYTDAAIFAIKRKIPTIILGPGEYDLKNNIYLGHQPNEYVKIENLEKATMLYLAIAERMLKLT
ncbi:MAG: M20 family metallopeptidase [Candidatus Methanomethyliales bacterium]|nr:M20 family metallopeptidase [Candidatus Methanomethylicales archaeon]